MTTQSRFPVKDADFSNYINISIPYVSDSKTRLVLTPTAQSNITALEALLNTADKGWNSVYPLCCNSATVTTTLVATKKSLRTQIETLLRAVYADIPQSVLTQTDRDTLNITNVSGSHTQAMVPVSVPSLTVSGRMHLGVTLTILDVERSLPITNVPDAVMVEIESAFLPNGVTQAAGFPQDDDFHFLANSGRSTYKRVYDNSQIKGTEFLKARYLNSRNEAGNWSEIISVTVA